MTQADPSNPYLSGNFAPLGVETELADLPVRGEIPRGLQGVLFRNGPNPHFPPAPEKYQWFTGDGMLHAFRIEDGRVGYRNRWVRTPRWQLEAAAGRNLFGGFDPRERDPSVMDQDGGVANTNIVWHAGRLLALEEAHLPTEIDPATLETKGYRDFGGKLNAPFTAHPKFDPVTGEMVFFGYGAAGPLSPAMVHGTVSAEGELTRLDRFQAPFASMVHDFMVTQNHVLFPILPLTGNMMRAMRGGPPYAWEPEKGAHIGVLRRFRPIEEMRWFHGPACYVFHPMNAWEADGRIIADVMQYDVAPLFPNPDGSRIDQTQAKARLARWVFDLDGTSDAFTSEYIDDLPGEFPRFDERRSGLSYRHGYFAAMREGKSLSGSYDTLAHIDHRTGKRLCWDAPAGDAVSEPVFVPRTAMAEEGDGWLLALLYRGAEQRSDLAVFEAGDIAAGPIGTARLPHRVPFGFHGNFMPL